MVFGELRTIFFLARRAYGAAMEPVCAKHGITRMELDILLFLANNPQMDTAADLVEARGLSKSHVSVSVADLTARGLLARSHRAGNRKSLHLTIQPGAAEIVADGQSVQRQMHAVLTGGFSPEELEFLKGLSDRIVENLRKTID